MFYVKAERHAWNWLNNAILKTLSAWQNIVQMCLCMCIFLLTCCLSDLPKAEDLIGARREDRAELSCQYRSIPKNKLNFTANIEYRSEFGSWSTSGSVKVWKHEISEKTVAVWEVRGSERGWGDEGRGGEWEIWLSKLLTNRCQSRLIICLDVCSPFRLPSFNFKIMYKRSTVKIFSWYHSLIALSKGGYFLWNVMFKFRSKIGKNRISGYLQSSLCLEKVPINASFSSSKVPPSCNGLFILHKSHSPAAHTCRDFRFVAQIVLHV